MGSIEPNPSPCNTRPTEEQAATRLQTQTATYVATYRPAGLLRFRPALGVQS